MHASVAATLFLISVGAVALGDTSPPPRLPSELSSALRANNVDLGEWKRERPYRCQGKRQPKACGVIKGAWLAQLKVSRGEQVYGVDLWVIEQPSVSAAKRLIKLLGYDDEFGGTFGKAPETHFRCRKMVLATVGTFRGPKPHDRVDRTVERWITSHCGLSKKGR